MRRKRFLLLVLVAWSPWLLSAQQYPWEGGFFLGAANYSGDLAENPVAFKRIKPVYGFHLRRVIKPALNLRLEGLRASLAGDDRDYPERETRGLRFTTQLAEVSLQVEWFFLKTISPRSASFIVEPYLSAGVGLTFYRANPDFPISKDPAFNQRILIDSLADIPYPIGIVPFGGGVRIQPAERWSLDLELGMRPAFTDYLDGVSRTGNPDKRDWYSFGGLRFNYRLGRYDADRDGVANAEDRCPYHPGPASLGGCPDSDGDGVADDLDLCATLAGLDYLGGCPDKDADGIADKDDLCPDEYGPITRGGCPLRDADGDGIEDDRDVCPDLPGPVEREGCPPVDTDKDGLLDEDDRCPFDYGTALFQGCPDSDGDGIPDLEDACPSVFGIYLNRGCPEVVLPEEVVAELNRQILLFEMGSAEIQQYSLLDRIAGFLMENPGYLLLIRGYAGDEDLTADAERLSTERARTCLRYLTKQGIPGSRMQIKGLGNQNLIANHLREKGPGWSQRVEFFLYY